MRQKLLLITALFFGALAFVLTYTLIQDEIKKARGGSVFVDLIQLKNDKAGGEVIDLEDVVSKRVKRFKSNLSRDIPWRKASGVIGSKRKLRASLPAGAMLKWSDLQPVFFGSGGLASIIPMNQRAISISVDATSSVTGLVRPGDLVDVIGTFRFPEMKGDKAFDTLTLTILQRVQVLATGTEMDKNFLSGGRSTSSNGRRKGYSTVTLSLTPKEVEMIIFATQKGRLHLSLRNSEDSMFDGDLQSVNFKYLEDNIKTYNQEREKRIFRR